MKRMITVALSGLLALALTGCNDDSKPADSKTNATEQTSQDKGVSLDTPVKAEGNSVKSEDMNEKKADDAATTTTEQPSQ